jgi:hypothetical protein
MSVEEKLGKFRDAEIARVSRKTSTAEILVKIILEKISEKLPQMFSQTAGKGEWGGLETKLEFNEKKIFIFLRKKYFRFSL